MVIDREELGYCERTRQFKDVFFPFFFNFMPVPIGLRGLGLVLLMKA